MTQTVLVKKAARSFQVGEILLLNCCDTGSLYGVLRGPYVIDEIKHQSDTGVSFFLRQHYVRTDLPRMTPRPGQRYLVEFARGQILQRLSGPPVTCLIEETP